MTEQSQEKLTQLERQFKPFIDHNLQFHVPECHSYSTNSSYSPIYVHYIGSPASSSLEMAEFYQAMKEAEYSYQTWKQMQEQIEKMIKQDNSVDGKDSCKIHT